MTVRAIDPEGCGCNGCLLDETGDSVPLEKATSEQITALLAGELLNHTGIDLADFTITVTVQWDHLTWTLANPASA